MRAGEFISCANPDRYVICDHGQFLIAAYNVCYSYLDICQMPVLSGPAVAMIDH